MAGIADSLADLHRLDLLAGGDSPCHRLDPRVKVATTLVFLATLVSFDRYEIRRLFPFLLFPAAVAAVAGLPQGYLLRKGLLALPFALAVALFNPIFDRHTLPESGLLQLSGGWVSFFSILIRSFLCIAGGLVLAATTGFPAICAGLERIGLPRLFVVQLLFLHRYLFVLGEEAGRSVRARELRSFGGRGMGIRPYASMMGHLLLRTWDRAERIHRAMLSRGFAGDFPGVPRRSPGAADLLFLVGWSLVFLLFRFCDLPALFGAVAAGLLR